MPFEYPWSCPSIDREIENAKAQLQDQISDLLNDACPFMAQMTVTEKSKQYVDRFYSAVEDCFEAVRKTNSDMREEAERQIGELEDECARLQCEINSMGE